jgi:transcriptional regulator with XRE-family HTH domain
MSLGEVIGERIRRARERKGLSQSDLARAVQKSRQQLFQIEQGSQHPRAELLVALAQALDVPTDYLLGLIPDDTAAPPARRRARVGA